MKPTDAGFDGAEGINLNNSSMPDGGVYRLRRSKKIIPDPKKHNLKNQLIWYYPDHKDAKLYYCNHNNQLFELEFISVELD
jgi:hypothetical protein